MFFQQTTKIQQPQSNFKVYGRIRPLNRQEIRIGSFKQPFHYDNDSITVNLKNMDHTFKYDSIFCPETKQESIFNSVAKNVINNAFQGLNSTVLCYGQTSSGKTHTIVGDFKSKSLQNQRLLPRILRQILNKRTIITQNHTNSMIDVRVKLSMVEIYNQKIIDLLSGSREHLRLRENRKKGVFIDHVTEKYVGSTQQGMDYVILGLQQRTVGRTNENVNSSRSHMMVILTITETNFHKKQARSAKLMLVDLAGSERLSRAGIQGRMVYETKKINLSLSTLGKVIAAITDPSSKHIPYRDSKLTRLLKQSIGGNSLTSLIVNLSPSVLNLNQTMSSLRFGALAKMVKNKPRVNKQYTVEELMTMLEKAQEKISELVKYIGQLEKVIANNVKNDVRLTQRLKTQRPVFSLQIIDDNYDAKSQSSTSKLSQSQNNMSEIIGQQGYSLINDFQQRKIEQRLQKPKMRKSQSCLNMTAKSYSFDNDDFGSHILSEKLQKMSHSPKNYVFNSTKEEQEDESIDTQRNDRKQKIVSMFQTLKFESQTKQVSETEKRDKDSQNGSLEIKNKKCFSHSLKLISQTINLTILKNTNLSILQNNKTLKMKEIQDQLNDIRQLYKNSQQKLVKYKSIIKQQDSYIAEIKQKHKAKKMRLSKDISQLQLHLRQIPN